MKLESAGNYAKIRQPFFHYKDRVMMILTKIHQRMHIHRPEEHTVLGQDLRIGARGAKT